MEIKTKKYLITSISLFFLFIIFTLLVKFVDVSSIGPEDSIVGFSSINSWYHNLVSVNFILYDITDYGGIIPFIYLFVFGLIGLIQLIKRKSLLKVDKNILALGLFFITTLIVYLFFQIVVINYRPVLIDNKLEASYPSSTTILSITLLVTGILNIDNYLKNKKVSLIIKIISAIYLVFLVIVRLISGVHWLTDIIAAIIISLALIYLYLFLNKLFEKIIK